MLPGRSCQFMGLELGQKDGPFIYDNAQEWHRTRRRSYEATKRAAADSSSHAPVFLGHIYDFLLDQSIPSIAYSVYIPGIRPLGFEGPVLMHSSHPMHPCVIEARHAYAYTHTWLRDGGRSYELFGCTNENANVIEIKLRTLQVGDRSELIPFTFVLL